MYQKIKDQANAINKILPDPRTRGRRIVIAGLVVTALAFSIFGIAAAYVASYQDKVYPGVYVGRFHLGGLPAPEVRGLIENINNRYTQEGIPLIVRDRRGVQHAVALNPVIVVGEDKTFEVISLDSERLTQTALVLGRGGNYWQRLVNPIKLALAPRQFTAPITADDNSMLTLLQTTLRSFEAKPQNAMVVMEQADPVRYRVIPEKSGWVINYPLAASRIKAQLERLSSLPTPVELEHIAPTITTVEAEKAAPALSRIFGFGPLNLNYIDGQTERRYEWSIAVAEYGQWLELRKDAGNGLVFGLRQEAAVAFLERTVRSAVDRPAQEAKFKMEDGQVQEFQGSKNGRRLNAAKTFADLDAAFRERNYAPERPIKTIAVAVDIVEPAIKTAAVNNLGITEVLGVGVSSFKGSPRNRIKNIRNATQKLNGVLIKPGEEFSTNKFAGPYTAENGYLPELVIIGREIKPGVGGGMCQISTTLFRMAMNSGMPITERRNHSLIVNYYLDPVNKNPGTDATVYDPLIDFKFLNDTGGYILIQTEIDEQRQELIYTLWGQPDGRQGSYTHPVVSKWFASGEPQEIETDKLKPGEKKCQHAYRGARASFTYTRITPQGEKIERVFESYYRPLPEICMVGKGEPAEEIPAEANPEGGGAELGEPAI